MAQRTGAMGKDPSQTKKPVVMDEAATANRERRIAFLQKNRPNDPEIKRLQGLVQKFRSTNPAQTAGQTGPTPEQITEQGFQGAGQAYQNMLGRFQQSDPYQMQQQYNPVFTQEMDRQRQNIMDTFNRRNAEEFARQDTATEQQILERGLDPSSPAAEAIRKANTQRQDLARQEAMSAGEQAALGAQQQYYQQAYQTGMTPYAQWEMLSQPYTAGITANYQQQQLAMQQEFERQQQRAQLASAERIARMRGAGGGGGSQGFDMNAWYDQQARGGWGQSQPQMNPVATGAQGFVAGVGQGIATRR